MNALYFFSGVAVGFLIIWIEGRLSGVETREKLRHLEAENKGVKSESIHWREAFVGEANSNKHLKEENALLRMELSKQNGNYE